uniref:uncharacterized protein si:dkey-111e8.4 n=1 Tax=Oncorhynchus gorbuscha TaxID=8017 RepID=UPI001EAEC6C9|nr:uncharacterized protein si:dkey-111e8.4 [Oncorhynchus gorbuscha]
MDVTEEQTVVDQRTSGHLLDSHTPRILALFQEAPCPQDTSGMSTSGHRYATASRWFASDIFIIFVVVLLLVLLVLGAVCCWFVRRNRTQRATAMKLTEIEIISAGDGLERETQAKFTLKIRTDQSHATQLVEMLVGRVRRLEGAGPNTLLPPLTSVTLPTVVSPTDSMASPAPAPLPVPTENMPDNQSVSQPTLRTTVPMPKTTSPLPYYLDAPNRPLPSEFCVADKGGKDENEDESESEYEDEDDASEYSSITD